MSARVDREKWEQRLRAIGMKGKLPAVLTEKVIEAAVRSPIGGRYMLTDGVIGGLALSTPITLYVVPTLLVAIRGRNYRLTESRPADTVESQIVER